MTMHAPAGPPAKGFFRRLYQGWMAIAGRFGAVQTLVVLAIFYAFVIGPVSTAIQLGRGDLLSKRSLRKPGSAWGEAESSKPDLERARHQF
jgi:hypothetical protein